MLTKLGLQHVTVFASGKNLATWTDGVGWDPETGTGLVAGRPVLRGISFGPDLIS